MKENEKSALARNIILHLTIALALAITNFYLLFSMIESFNKNENISGLKKLGCMYLTAIVGSAFLKAAYSDKEALKSEINKKR